MSTLSWRTGIALVAALAVPALAQAQARSVVVGVDAGGASHLRNLSSATPDAHFDVGFALGGSIGIDLSRYFGVHADFTYTRNKASGAMDFDGMDFNRYFYGVHLEARYPVARGLEPYVFAGGGAVTVDQDGITMVETFTKPAGMYGLGLGYAIPGSSLDFFAEAKNLVYRWDRAPYDRTLIDLTYAGGFRYHFPF